MFMKMPKDWSSDPEGPLHSEGNVKGETGETEYQDTGFMFFFLFVFFS